MPLMSWNDDLGVGIGDVDRQHHRLIELINNLHGAMLTGQSKEATGKVLDSLIDYTVKHFAFEERLFLQYVYPDSSKHKALHAELTSKVIDFKEKLDSGKLGVSVGLMNFLKSWLNEHIMGADKAYSPFLRGKGLN